MINIYKKIKSKYIGNIQYVVTTINVSLCIKKYKFNSIKEVDEFVEEINNETYWMVHKIEKIRNFDYQYNKNIKHSPLHFCNDTITEIYNINNQDYSFLKIDNSLTNVSRQ